MKKWMTIGLLFSGIEKACCFNSGLNNELSYIYGVFIMLVIVIVGTDQFLKYVFKKTKEHQEKIDEQSSLEHHPE